MHQHAPISSGPIRRLNIILQLHLTTEGTDKRVFFRNLMGFQEKIVADDVVIVYKYEQLTRRLSDPG